MKPFGIIDLHCDTLTESKYTGTGAADTLADSKRTFSLDAVPEGVNWAQFFAVWIQDEYRGDAALHVFDMYADSFYRQMEKFGDRIAPCLTGADIEKTWNEGKTAAVLTVENASVLGGKLENVSYVAGRGVRCMTIVWNGENEIASGHDTDRGFTPFGRQVIPEMEKNGILADISHLNDRGFYELLDIAGKPFTATHSNARAVCSHKRNLTDDMIDRMIERECLIGLNYYIDFISEDGIVKTPDGLFRHVCHFLEKGAGNYLALGSDFDGCELPEFINTPQKVAEFYEYLLSRGIPETQVNGIFYENALRFLKKNLTK